MSLQKAEDKQVIRTKEWIFETLIELLEKKEFKNIIFHT